MNIDGKHQDLSQEVCSSVKSIDHEYRVHLCSSSNLKLEIVEEFYKTVSTVKGKLHKIVPLNIKFGTPEQPINECTAKSCFERITKAKKFIDHSKQIIAPGDKILSIENGIYVYKDKLTCYDVCVIMIATIGEDHKINSISRYNSFGVEIDYELFERYMSPDYNPSLEVHQTECKIPDEYSEIYKTVVFCDLFGSEPADDSCYNSTFGEFLKKYFQVNNNNWTSDPRFGNVDRKYQIMDALNKYLVDDHTDVVQDYPKPGVAFKHMTSVTIDPIVLKIMYDLLENFVKRNFDIEKYSYFGGMDARGFYTAPVMARAFKKGFIPIRKASKVPKKYTVATESYSTEYSTDVLGLEYRTEFKTDQHKDQSVKKNALLFDDLLATGGTLLGAKSVMEKVGLNVDGAVMIYDVPALRDSASDRLKSTGIKSKVLINVNSLPNDFMKLSYKIPKVMFDRMTYTLEETKTPIIDRKFTLTHDQWDSMDQIEPDLIKDIDKKKLDNVVLIYADRDKEFSIKILEVLSRGSENVIDMLNMVRENSSTVTAELFNNGESRIKINTNIRNKHVMIVSRTRTGHINDDLMELLLIMDACNRAGSDKVSVVLPYYPYSRSDKKDDPRCPISASVVAKFLQTMNVNNLISVDLHAGQIQGYIDKGFHNLHMINYMCEHIYRNYLRFYKKDKWNDEFILIAPDSGSAKTVKMYSKLLGINNIIMDKDRNYDKPGMILESRYVGSKDIFLNKKGIIIDDMADTMGSMCSASKELVEDGLTEVYAFVTHGVLSGPAIKNINSTPYIKEVTVTDSLPQENNISLSPKIRVLSCAELIGRALDGILTGRSISRLFQKNR